MSQDGSPSAIPNTDPPTEPPLRQISPVLDPQEVPPLGVPEPSFEPSFEPPQEGAAREQDEAEEELRVGFADPPVQEEVLLPESSLGFYQSDVAEEVPEVPSQEPLAMVDWHGMYVSTEAALRTSEARVAALERLLDSQNRASATKVRQMTEDLAKRGQRIKELEAALKNASTTVPPPQPASPPRRKSVESNVSLAQSGVIKGLEKKLKAAEDEKERLGSIVQSLQMQREGSTGSQTLLLQARDAISELRRQLGEKEQVNAALQQKLSEAQTAILTNVEGISSLDSKLQQSRKALRWVLRQQGFSPSSRSPSPNYAAQPLQQPPPPAYHQVRSPSGTPQHILQQHDMLARSHLGHEQLAALRELEAMLAAREQQHHLY
eukprot:TRINITY_DN4339_c0_g1_i5.p1 TRINITY_DN4339_c0_g1~~TRINITY_DN4339_c0_g1_i5.p1  ORF type:complete len:402 (+),score=106.47 TRINITY_DN4339_c0_g1_i5:73-1206(+)